MTACIGKSSMTEWLPSFTVVREQQEELAILPRQKIAGKTGTSQVFSIGQDEELDEEDIPDHLKDHALFVAYAPPINPQIAIAVVVEHGVLEVLRLHH